MSTPRAPSSDHIAISMAPVSEPATMPTRQSAGMPRISRERSMTSTSRAKPTPERCERPTSAESSAVGRPARPLRAGAGRKTRIGRAPRRLHRKFLSQGPPAGAASASRYLWAPPRRVNQDTAAALTRTHHAQRQSGSGMGVLTQCDLNCRQVKASKTPSRHAVIGRIKARCGSPRREGTPACKVSPCRSPRSAR